jgi:hypothetical protein
VARLRALVDAVPQDAGEDHPALLAALDGWELAVSRIPYADRHNLLKAHRRKDGRWRVLHGGIVLAELQETAGLAPPGAGLDAYREHLSNG